MKRILFVDDDTKYLATMKGILELENYTVITATNANDAIEIYRQENIDLVLSDLIMSIIDGFQLLKIIRKYNPYAKIIILTSSQNSADEVEGLNLHANEYLKKTDDINVLLKRIENVLLQHVVIDEYTDKLGHEILLSNSEAIEVDTKNYRVLKNQQPVTLTRLEFDLLAYFLEHKNHVLKRDDIYRDVWGVDHYIGDTRAIDTYVKKLRQKLDISSIITIRSIGYEWTEK